MKTAAQRLALLALTAVTVTLSLAFAPPQDDDSASDPQLDKARAILGSMLGTWDITLAMGDAEPAKGTSKIRAVEGSSFVYEEFRTEMYGQPFMGLGVSGYDQTTRGWSTTWVDSAESGLSTTTGHWDEDTASIVQRSAADGDKPAQLHILRWTGDDSFVYVMGPEVEDFKPEMVIQYQRRK